MSVLRRFLQRLVQATTGWYVDQVPDQLGQMPKSDEWVCVFDARVGGRARAVFETRDRAMQFAEHHASALMPAGTPLKWEDANTATVSTTQLGDYLVARQVVHACESYGRPRQVA